MNKFKTLFLFCLLLPQFLYAEQSTDDLFDLSFEQLTQVKVIIATGVEQDIKTAPSTVTLITSEDIKKTGAGNLVDVLESVPGVHIKYDNFANRPLVHIRGGNSHQTLLMVNGSPMKDLVWASGIFWKGLPVSAIERVEVIRGPGSALYGADASTGVINVITKTAGKIEQSEAGIRAGSFDTQTAWMQSGGKWNDFDLGITANFSTTDGHDPSIKSDAQSVLDAKFNTNASYAPGKAHYGWDNQDIRFSIAKGNLSLLANYMHHDDLETGMTGAGVLDPVTRAEDTRYDIDLIYNNQHFSENWGIDAKLHYQNLDYDSNNGFQENPPGTSLADGDYPQGVYNHMESSEQQALFETSGLYSGVEDHQLRIGAGYNWQDLYKVEQQINRGTGADGVVLLPGGPMVDISNTPYAFAPEKTRKIYYAFMQDVWSITQDWELTAGVRYDHYSDFASTVNPRLALVWETTDKLTTKLMYGEAFRAPSFQELYADTSRAIANPNLDAEDSKTLELAFSYAATKDLNLGVNIYNFKTSNSISRDLQKQYQNLGRHKTTGIEMEASWQATRALRFSANYSHRDPENNELRVVEEPEQEAYLRSDWQFASGWNWNVQANWVADRVRADSDPRSDVDDYVITDTTLRYTGLQKWEFTASVRNLFDEDAREALGLSVADDFPLPERNFYAEVRYKF